MEYRVLLVHGIGVHPTGWSREWTENLMPYMDVSAESLVEISWDEVLIRRARGGESLDIEPEEEIEEARIRQELQTILVARASALAPRPRGEDGVVVWSEVSDRAGRRGLIPDWLLRPQESLGDFTRYLVSRKIRNAVKEKVKESLRPLAGGDAAVSILSHSWGTIVSYESLMDLLEDRSGRKPEQVETWINIHARGDLAGAWLSHGFGVDKEYEVPGMAGVHPYSSYFAAKNEVVLRDLVAVNIKS